MSYSKIDRVLRMQTGFEFRAYPSPQEQSVLREWIGCQRFIHNAKVGEDRYFRTFASKSLSLAGTMPPVDQCYSQFRDPELTPWLEEVPAEVLRNGAVRWFNGYARFFKGLGGRPTFHKKHVVSALLLEDETIRGDVLAAAASGRTEGTAALMTAALWALYLLGTIRADEAADYAERQIRAIDGAVAEAVVRRNPAERGLTAQLRDQRKWAQDDVAKFRSDAAEKERADFLKNPSLRHHRLD